MNPPLPHLNITVLKQLYFDQVKEALVKFDRSEEVDEAVRNAYAEAVRNDKVTSTRVSDETLILEEAMHYVDAGEAEGAQWKRIRSSLNQPVEKFKRMVVGSEAAEYWGKATSTIHASPELVLAYLWLLDSNENLKYQESSGLLLRLVEYLPNSFTQLADIGKVFPTVSNRLFSSRNAWGRVEDETGPRYVIAYQPRDLTEAEFKKIQEVFGNLVRGTARQVQIIEKVATNVSRITFVTDLGVGGMIPVAIANKLLSSYLDRIKD